MVFVFVCQAGGIILWDVGWGCATGTLKPFLSAAHAHLAYMGVRSPGFEVFAFASLDQQELFNVTSNALFCVLQVWQDFVRFVAQRLLSRGAN